MGLSSLIQVLNYNSYCVKFHQNQFIHLERFVLMRNMDKPVDRQGDTYIPLSSTHTQLCFQGGGGNKTDRAYLTVRKFHSTAGICVEGLITVLLVGTSSCLVKSDQQPVQ